MTLLVCATCPRYDRRRTGTFARALKAAIRRTASDVDVRTVQCLGGCPRHGVVALDGPGMARVRFTDLDPADAEDVVTAALAHASSGTGDLDAWDMPRALTSKISSVTAKRQAPKR